MIVHLRNEWRLLRRERGLWVLCGAYVLLLGYGCSQSVLRVRAMHRQVQAAVADYERRWAALKASAAEPAAVWGDWRSPSLVGGPAGFSIAYMPVSGLMALSQGESPGASVVKRISIYRDAEEPALQNPLAPAGGVFELAFVVVWLLPLTIAAAAHGAVSADRQTDTWRLVAATTAVPGRVLAARLVWPAGIATAATIVAGWLTVLLAAPVVNPAEWLRLPAWSGLVAIWALCWVFAVGCITARSSTAAASLTAAGMLWIALTWIVPGVVDAVAAASEPPPNRADAHIAAREVQRDLEQRLPAMLEAIYTRHPEWRPSAAAVAAATTPVPGGPASRDSRRVYAPALAAAEIAVPLGRAAADRRARVEARVRRWAIASPALAVQAIADHLAGSSAERLVLFARHATAREEAWHAFFGPRILRLQEMTRADMDQVPALSAFHDHPPLADIAWPAAGLVGAVTVAGLAFVRSRRFLRG
jgi:ABC-2 type transport system permease protein